MEIMSFTNTDNFIEKDHSFFPMRSCPLQIQIILLPFLLDIFCSFPCLVALIQICTTVLNKNGKSGHPYLIIDLRGRLPLFHHSCVVFADAFFTHEEIPFISNLFSVFTMKACWIFFSNAFSLSESIVCLLSLTL